MSFLFAGIGAAIGAVLRYETTAWIKKHTTGSFPLATFLINLAGAFVLGLLAGRLVSASSLYLLFGTGICGGFTTFSTFSYETVILLREKKIVTALIYQLFSLALGVLSVAAGFFLL